MMEARNPISFFEIPAKDFERAKGFYESVIGSPLEIMDTGEHRFGFFPKGEQLGGAIVEGDGYIPGQIGTLIYLNGSGDFDGMLDRIEQGGGKVIMPRTSIGEFGFIARFIDCEGNLIALHTM